MNNCGYFKMDEYLQRLEENLNVDKIEDKAGIVIPDENKKAYDWLKKQYDSAKVEVKVDMKIGNGKFNPGYEMQADVKSVGKDFEPGMFGNTPKQSNSGKETDFKPNNFSTKTTKSEDENKSDTTKKSDESDKETATEKSETTDNNSDDKTKDYKKSNANIINSK